MLKYKCPNCGGEFEIHTHGELKCPFCGTKLRLRRVKGKHTSRCPKCGQKFTVRVWRGKQ